MKFRRIILVFIFLVLLAAWYTRPSLDKFRDFYRSEMTIEAPPVIDFSDKFIYTSVEVNFFSPARLKPGQPLKAVSVKKEEYIGLFGRFFKR